MDRSPDRVLVVDNDDDTLEIVCRMLRGWRLEADCSPSGPDGMGLYHAARAGGRAYDLVITDAAMPEMTGLQLIGAVRALDTVTPVLMITAFDENMMRVQAAAAGADGILIKPLDPDEFKGRVFDLLERGRPAA